ncbi:hypothetical protein [Roseovarius sp.]
MSKSPDEAESSTIIKGMRTKFLKAALYTKNMEQIQALKVDLI